jgi:hypothetical protein
MSPYLWGHSLQDAEIARDWGPARVFVQIEFSAETAALNSVGRGLNLLWFFQRENKQQPREIDSFSGIVDPDEGERIIEINAVWTVPLSSIEAEAIPPGAAALPYETPARAPQAPPLSRPCLAPLTQPASPLRRRSQWWRSLR